MALFKSNIRSRVMAHINTLIEEGEKKHQENVEKAHDDYNTTVADAAIIRDNKKKESENQIVDGII
jgi:hypothetical protein